MALWDRVMTTLALRPVETEVPRYSNVQPKPLETRAIDSFADLPGLTEQLLRVQGLPPRPWRAAGMREALGVPAIFGAVNLIANLIGSLSMKALRDEVEVPPSARPRIIIRPDPFVIPREFYRGTGYNLASRGETWWWTAARDSDGQPLSVINVNPAEVTVEEDPKDLRYPIVRWRNKIMPREDFRQLVYAKEPGALRGHGPLQACGAAISVAVESQEWAANFYINGNPSFLIKSASELSEDPETGIHEADTLRNKVMGRDPNTAMVIDPGIDDVKDFPVNEHGAQMLQARGYQNVEIATMFGMDATMLNAAIEGSSLTYQNVGTEFEKFLRKCLRPNYLEVIEQTMSDLLPRNTVARFNTDALTLADIKTRYEVYGIGIDHGIIDSEEARSFEGLAPGDVENAAVPYSPPQAIPTRLPIQENRSQPAQVRCDGKRLLRGVLTKCNKLLAEAPPFSGRCPRCNKEHSIAAPVVEALNVTAAPTPVFIRTEEPTEPVDLPRMLTELMESMPERIAAAIPRPEAPVVNIHEGAFRSDVHMPEQRTRRIERDGTTGLALRIVTEE